MRSEDEIFREWLDVTFPGENLDTSELKSLKNTMKFQCYLVDEMVWDAIEDIVEGFREEE